jgi:hypothetical protein
MDRTATIISYQWRAYWRRFHRGGKLTVGNQGIALLILLLIFVRYLQWLHLAANNLAAGKTRLFEFLLTIVFLAWLFPLATSDADTIANRRWLHLPLSLKKLLVVRVSSLLTAPTAWIIVAASLSLLYPVLYAGRGAVGIAATLLFVLLSTLTGLTLSQLINVAWWRRGFVIIGSVSVGAIAFYLSRWNASPHTQVLPTSWVTQAILGRHTVLTLLILALLCCAAYAAALWSLRLSLTHDDAPAGRRSAIAAIGFPGKLGGLVAKDFKYFRRLLDVYLQALAVGAGCVYLATAELPTRGTFLAFIVIFFLLGAAVPFNSFGLDQSAGLDRYALFPLPGKAIILSKNLAYLVVIAIQLTPLLLLAGWQLGMRASGIGLVMATAQAFAYLSFGNWTSVSHPVKMQFFRFASSGAALADAMAGIVFGSLPGILMIYLLHRQEGRAAWQIPIVVLLFAALYVTSVERIGKRFERHRETIASALS